MSESESGHDHRFSPDDWLFDGPANTLSYCTEHVMDAGYFIEEVYHDHDGDWQFFHNDGDASGSPRVICLGCVCDHDPTVMALGDMPAGWFAYRDDPDSPWQRKPYERQDEDD